ncbi:MAG: type IV pilus biogenesis/stability protein PilW [Gammaproteobacteria bacterium]|nr:type IV pilus biogenesis/stability protein PilW [Gammaproteobacteria bacterium]
MVRLIAITLFLVGCAGTPNQTKLSYNPKAAEANAELGKSYMQRGNNTVALNKLNRALEFNPKSANAHHYIAELYRRVDKPEDADRHYRLAIDNSLNDSALFNNYGVFLCGEKRIDDAMVQFEKVLKDPVYRYPAQVYENLGICMAQNGQMVEAERNLRKALSINPKLPKSLFELSKISLSNDKLFSARAFINRYEENSEQSAESLWLGVEIEKKFNNHEAVKKYGEQLLEKFPLSDEAEKYHRLTKR